MLLKGFNVSPEADYYLKLLLGAKNDSEIAEIVSRVRQLSAQGDAISYTLPGLPLCWKCTLKHVGQAAGFAAEVENYPERIACVIGELGHAYRECPDKELSVYIRSIYTKILDTGCVPDFTELLKKTVTGWRESLIDT